MTITLKSGRVLKVQFVHSSPDLNAPKLATPGGLRQFVDNLSRSLNRRVTLCDISDVLPGDATTTTTYEAIGQGFAVCYYKDTFQKVLGRGIALLRAINNIHDDRPMLMDEATTVGLLDAFPKEVDAIEAYEAAQQNR